MKGLRRHIAGGSPGRSVLVGSMCLTLVSCEATAPEVPRDPDPVVQRGSRVLSLAISDRADGDFGLAYSEAVAAGVQATSLSLSWDDLETQPGVFSPTPHFLQIGADFYGPAGTKLVLGINPIDTNNNRVPGYLDGLAWDDPQVVDAFKALLDWALPIVGAVDLHALSIGNEIDATLASTSEWTAYTSFWEQVSSHARSIRPGLRVGSKVTIGGITGPFADRAFALNQLSDVVLTTYYPLNGDFTIKPPSSVQGVFDDVVNRYPGRTIMFAEIGSPSTTQCGSSQTLQAEFVREAFQAWDRHADHVELLEWVWQHDIPPEAVATFEQYYGLSNPCFLDYLGTLGLKSFQGQAKPAWTALETEAARRGW